jgi:23S rRNA pseudouridine2605 synthase
MQRLELLEEWIKTTGLLLFTNDTDMIRKFTLPSQKSSKIYQVSLDKNLKFEDLENKQRTYP